MPIIDKLIVSNCGHINVFLDDSTQITLRHADLAQAEMEMTDEERAFLLRWSIWNSLNSVVDKPEFPPIGKLSDRYSSTATAMEKQPVIIGGKP